MKMLNVFKENLNSIFKKSFDEMQKVINDFDFEDVEKQFNSVKKSLNEGLEDFKSYVKNCDNKYIVKVPYDRDTQVINFAVSDSEFKVDVKPCEDCGDIKIKTSFSSVTTIPEDVKVDTITHNYDELTKTMTFIFKKDTKKDDEVVEEESNEKKPIEKTKELVKKIVDMYHNEGMSYRKIAKKIGISDKTVKRWINEWTGEHTENVSE